MGALALFAVGFAGTVFWVLNTEATAVYYGTALGWPALEVGVICALGQTTMYAILYFGGERLIRSWRWLDEKVARTRERFRGPLERGFLLTAGVGAVLGIPPATAMPPLAAGFRVKLCHFLPVMFAGRVIRFTLLAAGGATVAHWVG